MVDFPSSMPIEAQMDADKGGLEVPQNTFTQSSLVGYAD